MSAPRRALALAALGLSLPFLGSPAAGQVPGGTPRLFVVDDEGDQAPDAGGPFDNSGVLAVTAGQAVDVTLSYLAEGQPNDAVPWGLMVSAQSTPFPVVQVPPPLFVLPPFVFLVPAPATLDVDGNGSIPLSVPPGLFDATSYVQALVQDVTSFPALKLSNGVRVDVGPPAFHVRFGLVRAAPNFGLGDVLEGVGTMDLDSATMATLPPFGTDAAPFTTTDDIGIGPGFRFLPVVPNIDDGPVTPLARPGTRITEPVDGSSSSDVFPVEDTTGFPPEGRLWVATQGSNPYRGKGATNTNPPSVEVVRYSGRTATSFTGVQRKQIGSTGESAYPHAPGDLVIGEYGFVTTAGALTRTRVGVDSRNERTPHVVVPAFTVPATEGDGEETTMDLDLYLFEDEAAGVQGFCVFDHVSHGWRLIEGTQVDITGGEKWWNPLVALAPDGRSMVAAVRTFFGPVFDSAPDELWAIRLDGRNWPATGTEAWQITYEEEPDPEPGDVTVRSRRIWMPATGIVGAGPGDYVAYVGLAPKFAQSDEGDNLFQINSNLPFSAFEFEWLREEQIVRDYIEVPLVGPGSTKMTPVMPRPWITSSFPATGLGDPVRRFDPHVVVAPDGRTLYLVAGAEEKIEDMYVIRGVSISASGVALRQILNISGLGQPGSSGEEEGEIRAFHPGGHGRGGRLAISPSGAKVAWLYVDHADRRDWIHIGRTNAADFGKIQGVYKDPNDGRFREDGPYENDRIVAGMTFVDADRLVFLMGDNPYDDPFGDVDGLPGLYDAFLYTISTDEMVNLTGTGGSVTGFGDLGLIRPAATWISPDRTFFYVARRGEISQGNTVLDPGSNVCNIFGVDLTALAAFDVTGDEFGTGALLPNLALPSAEAFDPVASVDGLVEAGGVQDGLMYFTGHVFGDPTETDELFAFDRLSPGIAFQATQTPDTGAHISNVTPSPSSSLVAFARTAGPDPLAVDQHPFVVDLDNFLFERDLAPTLVVDGQAVGRVMDGSLHFVPPAAGAGEALVFSIGNDADAGTGLAAQAQPVYYPLVNVSNPLLEPLAQVLPLASTGNLGFGYRIFLVSAGPSATP